MAEKKEKVKTKQTIEVITKNHNCFGHDTLAPL